MDDELVEELLLEEGNITVGNRKFGKVRKATLNALCFEDAKQIGLER
jgi:hypothetical protein